MHRDEQYSCRLLRKQKGVWGGEEESALPKEKSGDLHPFNRLKNTNKRSN